VAAVRSVPDVGMVSEKSAASAALRSVEGPSGAHTGFRGVPRRARTEIDRLGSTKGRGAGIKMEIPA